jgi:hypothetical protein
MITCYLRYVIDPFKLKEFEKYGKLWIPLVENLVGNTMAIFCRQRVQITLHWPCSLFLTSHFTKTNGTIRLKTQSV